MDGQVLSGTLYVVATPLGNLEDMTFRAVKILKCVNLIAAEDTRNSKKLLTHYGITTKLVSYHEHNEEQKTDLLITRLKQGLDIALISDAGTPLISDPGYKLIAAAAKDTISIIPIPGCSAAIAGLSVAGLPTDSFLFLGFPPRKQQKQQNAIESVKNMSATLIFYESPKRIKKFVATLKEILGDRNACLAREITKLHEEYIRGKLSEIARILSKKESIKGECTIFIQGCSNEKAMDKNELEKIILARLSNSNLGTSGLAKQISRETGLSKNLIYEMIIKLGQLK